MIRCRRCFLHKFMRIVNCILNVLGIIMIIYSLWLLKKWNQDVAELNPPSPILKPWFIYTFLAVGIVLCLSTVSGLMVANCSSNLILAIYIISIFSILLIQAGVTFTIFFKIDWESWIAGYIDGKHKEFRNFIVFHLIICRLISILVLAAQVKVILLAAILWAVGTEPRVHCSFPGRPNLSYSFLVDHNSPLEENPERV